MDYELFIDESCHLLNDGFPVMCIGYIKVSDTQKTIYAKALKQLMSKHASFAEIKWVSVSASRMELYKEIVNYFFENELYFRCIINKNKSSLNHEKFNDNDHSKYYFKLVFLLIDTVTNPPQDNYRVFIDVKDTNGKERINGIEKVLSNKYFNNSPFKYFQHIHSHDSLFMQIADLLIGAITYKLRGEHLKATASRSKIELINHIEQRAGHSLDAGTKPYENKFNVFDHYPNKK